ncbi:hypothetical protein BLX87_00195, partial [Bacillus sp. VT-16-64]
KEDFPGGSEVKASASSVGDPGSIPGLGRSPGRLDHNVEVAAGDEQKYVRLNTNRSVSNSYQDGDGTTVPSDWERWNADLALGWWYSV